MKRFEFLSFLLTVTGTWSFGSFWVLTAGALALGACNIQLVQDDDIFVCESTDDCLPGYVCQPRADSGTTKVCLPEDFDAGTTDTSTSTDTPDTSQACDPECGEGQTCYKATCVDTSNFPPECPVDLVFEACPAGSSPRAATSETSQCTGAGLDDLIIEDGEIVGQCQQAESCLVFCALSDPCACGISVLDKETIVCSDCGNTACGNGICENGESGEDGAATGIKCHTDCRNSCIPGTSRCFGADTQVCRPDGIWGERVPCPPDLTCRTLAAGAPVDCQNGIGACCLGPCTVGDESCMNSHQLVSVCDGQGEWEDTLLCQAGNSCQITSAGQLDCLPPCEVGALLCGVDNGSVLRCTEAKRFATQLDCAAGSSCQENSSRLLDCLPDCTPAATECNIDSTAVRSCGPNQRWDAFRDCSSAETCKDDGAGGVACL